MIDFFRRITTEAGKLILQTSQSVRSSKAGSGNWVTEADLASEQYLISSIKKAYPSHRILTEETRSDIAHPEQEEHLCVIDPLDGTTNFAFGIPLFAVSVAYVEHGVVRCGAVYDPCRHELFWATRGAGAFLNNDSIYVRKRKTFSGSLVNVGSPYKAQAFAQTYPLARLFHGQGARIVNLGTAALECAYIASGRLSFFYEVGLKPWDIAAGSLLIEEAGGKVVTEGKTFNPFHFERFLAGNAALIKKAQRLIAT